MLGEKDWATLRAGVRLVREIGRQTPLPSFTTGEIFLWPDCRSDTAIDAHIRATAITAPPRWAPAGGTATRQELAEMLLV
jgi:choline dehydrogenase-like flavoprotein